MYGCGLNFLTVVALPFSLPMRRSSGVKEVVYLLAFLHSLSAARLSLPGSPLGVYIRWETAAFGLPLVGSSWALGTKNVFRAKSGQSKKMLYQVGSWLVENTDADSWFENTVYMY